MHLRGSTFVYVNKRQQTKASGSYYGVMLAHRVTERGIVWDTNTCSERIEREQVGEGRMRDGGKRRGLQRGCCQSARTPQSQGAVLAKSHGTRVQRPPCHRRARMFIVPDMNVIIQSHPGWELQVD